MIDAGNEADERQAADAQALAEASAAEMFAADAASQKLGMRIVTVGPGSATMTMRVADWMTNGHGTCHGGFIFTLADSAFAFACNSYDQRCVAQAAQVTFIAPAFEGDLLCAAAREVARYGRSGIYDIAVRVGDRAIAEFRGHSRSVRGTVLTSDSKEPTSETT